MLYFDTFTGIGGFTLGIQQALPEATCVGYSEIDKYASSIYRYHFPYRECENCRLEKHRQENLRISGRQKTLDGSGTRLPLTERPGGHFIDQPRPKNNCTCKHKPYGDITKINTDTLPDFDLLVGGFPCQAFSIAGKRAGFEDTRGTLFFDLARILRAKRPRNFIFENVKGLLSHDNGNTFKTIISTLAELGYSVEWQVLNSKNHGVPQNRERVYIIGHLGGITRRQVFPVGGDVSIPDGQTEPDSRRTQAEVSHTLRGSNIKADQVFIKEPEIRRLTPTECERLQSFPDGWTKQGINDKGETVGISDSQRYKTLGNAVTVNVVKNLIQNLYA